MSEHQEQAALIDWARRFATRYPELELLFAIPNAGGFSGGFKSNVGRVAKLRAEGVAKGVPDLCLPVPRGIYAGLWVEMKHGNGRLKPEQKAWAEKLTTQGHKVVCYNNWTDAAAEIVRYLNGEG